MRPEYGQIIDTSIMGPGDFQMFMYLPSFSLAITLTWLNNPCALYFPSKASICQTGFRQQYRVVSTEGLLFMRGCSAYMHACLRTHTKSRPHFFRFLLNKAFGNSAHLQVNLGVDSLQCSWEAMGAEKKCIHSLDKTSRSADSQIGLCNIFLKLSNLQNT